MEQNENSVQSSGKPEMQRLRVNAQIVLAILPFLVFSAYLLILPFTKTATFVGWDTPAYIYSTKILASDGLGSFLVFWVYNRFIYSLILYPFYILSSASLFTVARILPVVLSLASISAVGLLLHKWFNNKTLAATAIVFASVWLAPYILASNLYSQLLTLLLLLIWLSFEFEPQKPIVQIAMYGIFCVAAISHVYTVIVFYLAIVLSYGLLHVTGKKSFPSRKTVAHLAILGLLTILPLVASTLLTGSLRVFGPLLTPTQIQETILRPISGELVFTSLGGNLIFLLPLALIALIEAIYLTKTQGQKLKYYFIFWWMAISLLLLPVAVFYPHLVSLSERIIIVAPLPILLALFALRLKSTIISYLVRFKQNSRVFRSNWFKGAILAVIILPMFLVSVNPTIGSVDKYSRPWITEETSQNLQWVSENMQFQERPLFVINTLESTMADHIELWDNAIGAYIGPHYLYVGPIANLAQLRATAFASSQCSIYSAKYFNQLNESGILSNQGLNRTIILLDSFYDLDSSEVPFVENMSSGVSTVLFSKLWAERVTLNTETLNAYADVTEKNGLWYGLHKDWSSNPYVLEFYRELYSNVTSNESVSYSFYTYDSANYSINVRYYKFAGYNSSMRFSMDNKEFRVLSYFVELNQPSEEKLAVLYLQSGWHKLSIQPQENQPTTVNLDYIKISKFT